MDPPKEPELISIFWVREEYFYVYNSEKKKLCDLGYGPFTSKEKADQAVKDLLNLGEKLKTFILNTKFSSLFASKYKNCVCSISTQQVPRACLVLKFPDEPENTEMMFHAVYNQGTSNERTHIGLVNPLEYDLAWMKLTSLGFFIEDLNYFLR